MSIFNSIKAVNFLAKFNHINDKQANSFILKISRAQNLLGFGYFDNHSIYREYRLSDGKMRENKVGEVIALYEKAS